VNVSQIILGQSYTFCIFLLLLEHFQAVKQSLHVFPLCDIVGEVEIEHLLPPLPPPQQLDPSPLDRQLHCLAVKPGRLRDDPQGPDCSVPLLSLFPNETEAEEKTVVVLHMRSTQKEEDLVKEGQLGGV
jgi:hypothetical protein